MKNKDRVEKIQRLLRSSERNLSHKTAGHRMDEIISALKTIKDEKLNEDHIEAWSRHLALNAGMAMSQLSQAITGEGSKNKSTKDDLLDALHSTFFAGLPPTHHTPKEMAEMLPYSHMEWLQNGMGGPNPLDEKEEVFLKQPEDIISIFRSSKNDIAKDIKNIPSHKESNYILSYILNEKNNITLRAVASVALLLATEVINSKTALRFLSDLSISATGDISDIFSDIAGIIVKSFNQKSYSLANPFIKNIHEILIREQKPQHLRIKRLAKLLN